MISHRRNRAPACRRRSCASPSSRGPSGRSPCAARRRGRCSPRRPRARRSRGSLRRARSGANGWRSSSARPACGREVGRRERPGPVARLEERRARAVDDVDRRCSCDVDGPCSASRQLRGEPRERSTSARATDPTHPGRSVATATCRDPARNRRPSPRAPRASRCVASTAASARRDARRPRPPATRAPRRLRPVLSRSSSLPLRTALRSLRSIGSAATVAASARSSSPTGSSGSPMNMPAVSRSRVADGSITSRATCWPSRSDGTTCGRPSGNTTKRSSAATMRFGKLDDHAFDRVPAP